MIRNIRVEGIIIKRQNYAECDRIITVLTGTQGKLKIKARGVRRISSRRSPHVELLNQVDLILYKGSKYPILLEAQVSNDFSGIKADLTRVGLAYHLCELIDGLCPENQQSQTVFFLLKKTLEMLSETDDVASLVYNFEVKLLTTLGFWHHLPNAPQRLDTQNFIENLLERRLKSKRIFLNVN